MRRSADAATTRGAAPFRPYPLMSPCCGTLVRCRIRRASGRHRAARSPPSRRRATGEDGAGVPNRSLRGRTAVTWLEWALGFMLLSLYITCLFTVCSMTFQKGRTVLGIVGIFAPWLWLVGAFLPAKKGSRYELAQQAAGQRQVAQP